MSVFACLFGKVEAGLVKREAAEKLQDWIAARAEEMGDARAIAENRLTAAALDLADVAKQLAAREADLALRTIEAQLGTLTAVQAYKATVGELRATQGDFGFGSKAPALLADERKSPLGAAIRSLFWRDPHEVASWGNLHYLARTIKGEAHAAFADGIEALRSKMLGFRRETARETDMLAAVYGEAAATPEGRAIARSWAGVAKSLFDQFNAAGGAIPERKSWRLPNPTLDRTKVAAVSRAEFIADMREMNAREDMLDFATGQPLDDAGFARVMGEVYDNAVANWVDGPPSAATTGRPMLANARRDPRIIALKDAASWQSFAGKYGTHDSPFEAMMNHVGRMSEDIAMLRTLGPNPEGHRRYILSLFDRELEAMTVSAPEGADDATKSRAVKANRKAEDQLRKQRRDFETMWAHVTGAADQPVNTTIARLSGDMRSWLVSTQMGSAIISSISDTATLAMASRMNGLPVMDVIGRAVRDLAEPGSEIRAAQMGLVADSLANGIHAIDRFNGETIRAGRAGQLASGVIRASGLRRWSSVLRNSFALETMALYAREASKAFAELDPQLQQGLGRYGIDADGWDVIRATPAHAERPNALLLRPMDVRAQGGEAAGRAADAYKRLIDTEMDYAVIESDPMTRALIFGQSRPGTAGGEVRRAFAMYKSFPVTFVTMHFARAAARGWDGSRLGHAALGFSAMWALGLVALQAKQVANGKDPYSLDPTTTRGQRAFAQALLQGGGLGIFGDFIGQDQTRHGNSLVATLAGPQFAAAEKVSKFLVGNLQRAGQGEPTHFAGDALYTAAGFVPFSSLWYGRLTFQRGVVDQLALMIDPRTPDRFRRIEAQAAKDFDQRFWWRPGEVAPSRSPDLGGGT